MIEDRVSEIIGNIETNARYGRTSGGGYNIAWCAWENAHNRIVFSMFSIQPMGALTAVDMQDSVAQVDTEWGTRAYDYSGEGIITIESERVIGDEVLDPDVDDDEIIR